jgi:hypothetical protein
MRQQEKDSQWALKDLREHTMQSSIDWQADLRFARHLNDPEAVAHLEEAANPKRIQLSKWEGWDRLTKRRLKALRCLVNAGLAVAEWRGTGDWGLHLHGARRARCYELNKRRI